MPKPNLSAVEASVRDLGNQATYDREFIFQLLEAYGRSKSSITRLRSGSINVAAEPDTEVAQKGALYYRESLKQDDELLVV